MGLDGRPNQSLAADRNEKTSVAPVETARPLKEGRDRKVPVTMRAGVPPRCGEEHV